MDTSIIVAVIIGLVQTVKAFGLDSRWAAGLAVVFGVVIAFAVAPAATTGLTVFNGIVFGLTAAGLYSGVRATLNV